MKLESGKGKFVASKQDDGGRGMRAELAEIVPLATWRPSKELFYDELGMMGFLASIVGVLAGMGLRALPYRLPWWAEAMGGALACVFVQAMAYLYIHAKAQRSAYILAPEEFCFFLWGLLFPKTTRIRLDEVMGLEIGKKWEGKKLFLRLKGGRVFGIIAKEKEEIESALRAEIFKRTRKINVPRGPIEVEAENALAPFLDPAEKLLFAVRTSKGRRSEDIFAVTNYRLLHLRLVGRGREPAFVRWHKADEWGEIRRAEERLSPWVFSSWEFSRKSWRRGMMFRQPEPSPIWELSRALRKLEGATVVVTKHPPDSRIWIPGAPFFIHGERREEILLFLLTIRSEAMGDEVM